MKKIKVLFLNGSSTSHLDIFSKVIQEIQRFSYEIDYLIFSIPSKFRKRLPLYKKMFDKERILFASKVIEKERPDVMVLANDQGIHATFIKVGRSLGIPTLAIQDGILTEKEEIKKVMDLFRVRSYLLWRVLSAFSRVPVIERISIFSGWRPRVLCWGLGGVERIAAMGEYYKRLFIRRGVHPNRIAVTGYPLFDDVPRDIAAFDKTEVLHKLGLKKDNKIAVLATQPFVEDGIWSPAMRERLINSVIEAVEQIDDLHLIVKLHPREDMETYSRIIGERATIIKDVDLNKLLLTSDIVLTVSSTVGLWALLYERPLVIVDPFPLPYPNIYHELAVEVKDLEKLPLLLRDIFEKSELRSKILKKAKNVLYNYTYRVDGQASKRIAKLIVSLIEKRHQRESKTSVGKTR